MNVFTESEIIFRCSSPCKGAIEKGGDNATFSVHRYQQHLDLVVFRYAEDPQVLIAGCETMNEKFICSHVLHETDNNQLALSDNLCVCQGLGETCGQHTPIGTWYVSQSFLEQVFIDSTHGDLTWWVDDPGRTTPTPPPTTTDDRRNSFHFFLNFNETSEVDKRLRDFKVYANMDCSLEECSYHINVTKNQNYFTVFVGLEV